MAGEQTALEHWPAPGAAHQDGLEGDEHFVDGDVLVVVVVHEAEEEAGAVAGGALGHEREGGEELARVHPAILRTMGRHGADARALAHGSGRTDPLQTPPPQRRARASAPAARSKAGVAGFAS